MSHAANAEDVLEALTNLDSIYSAGVELAEESSIGGLRAWHISLISVEDYEPIFADGYLLNGTNAAATVSAIPSVRWFFGGHLGLRIQKKE